MKDESQPIFILGSARSGTTLIGNYIGTSSLVCDMGEYFGFYWAHDVLVDRYKRVPTPYKESFLRSIQEHVAEFANLITRQQGLKIFCDSTPWNLLIIKELSKRFPNAIFILCIRHYTGVIQSLGRSFSDGYQWAGENYKERAEVYRMCYSNVESLPYERTVPISYDSLCSNPKDTLLNFKERLKELNFDVSSLNENIFVNSYATNPLHERPTLAFYNESQEIEFSSISSYNALNWSKQIEEEVYPIVRETDCLLENLFPEHYKKPIDLEECYSRT